MRFRAVLWCCVIAFLPQLVLAADPPGETGALHAVFDFCAQVDPALRADFDRQANALFRGLKPAQIAAIVQSTEYKRGYQMLAGVLPQLKHDDAVVACQAVAYVPKPGHKEEERTDHR